MTESSQDGAVKGAGTHGKRLLRGVIDIAEEKPEVGPEGPERDGDVPPLPSPAMGVRSMERYRRKNLQGSRSLAEEAYEAGHKDGYGDGYVDGYDDGQYNQLIGLIKELDDWCLNPVAEPDAMPGIYDIIWFLRQRLEHEP